MGADLIGAGARYSSLGKHIARFLVERNGSPCQELTLAAMLLSRAVEGGHVCLHLDAPHPSLWGEDIGEQLSASDFPEAVAWAKVLRATRVVGAPGEFKPLILDADNRLYLQRYRAFETSVAQFIRERAGCLEEGVDEGRLRAGLDRYFPDSGNEPGVDWQRVAAVASVLRLFSVISGGPGTGKTTTVVKILGLLVEQSPLAPPRIALAAPTGKAAARLKESIRTARDGLNTDDWIRAEIPADVSTVHRLLGYQPGSTEFRHNAENPLRIDVLVVDEASMVALPLMARLTAALPPHAKLILLGDHNQLASVEAGAVLGDICNRQTGETGYSRQWVKRLAGFGLDVVTADEAEGAGGLADAITVLRRNYRFPATSGIGSVSALVNLADPDATMSALTNGSCQDLTWRGNVGRSGLEEALREVVLQGFGAAVTETDPQAAHQRFEEFRILCATRSGGFGVDGLNHLVEGILAAAGKIRPEGRWYPGRPVMVTRNDYNLGVFNGDIGITLPSEEAGGELRVFFPVGDGGIHAFSPTRVPDHETAYAMTVHKSQGSEFERVLLVLGTQPSRVLTRELLYTGMTRARSHVEIWGSGAVLRSAVSSKIERSSGLGEALWNGNAD